MRASTGDRHATLSCSSLASAQSLSNKLNQPLIATPGYVRIHSDGGLTVVASPNSTDTDWYEIKPATTATSINKAPISTTTVPHGDAVSLYVTMGKGDILSVSETMLHDTLNQYDFTGWICECY